MRTHLILPILAALAVVVPVVPATAASTSFSGTILDSCTLSLGTAGVLGINSDGNSLSSGNPGGVAASALLVSTSANYKLEVDAPSAFAQAPAGGQADAIVVSYAATGVSLGTNIGAGTPLNLGLGLTQVTMNTTATKSSGLFPAGTYRVDVVMRCAPR